MKLIHKFKSPNFNERRCDKVDFIIIHYTALKSITDSINYLCSKKNKVSCHYLVSKRGKVYNLVSEKKRAWHAGQSYWRDIIDINSYSIGIELDYYPEKIDTKYSKELVESLIWLLKKLIKKYAITPDNILAHSDVAPYRKIDPGENFPWELLEDKNLSFKITRLKTKNNKLIKNWFIKKKFFSKKRKALFMLSYLGYDVSLALMNQSNFKKLILSYGSHFQYYKNINTNKKNILQVIELHFLKILLTKFKKRLNVF